jgi:hypothetical protein
MDVHRQTSASCKREPRGRTKGNRRSPSAAPWLWTPTKTCEVGIDDHEREDTGEERAKTRVGPAAECGEDQKRSQSAGACLYNGKRDSYAYYYTMCAIRHARGARARLC